ncbi:hypothetical protein EYS42_08800 [Aquabacterium lacunae]|uniref:Uncharacterized protein n=1 Tax=Aquabacterium lacunae TaxID=2528630 RepID=A0A4Q9H0S1_9BURK|nr:hypothetical protein [Aquabacterium lacunae]TBO31333.1 hypothetical protein EYS42_08800 [Aquabacterium lacunae]
MSAADTTEATLAPDLAELQAIATAQDAAIAGGNIVPGQIDPAGEPEPQANQAEELAAMLQMGVVMLSPALPFLPQCYTPEACHQIGVAFDAVAQKHGWNLDAVKSPELALAVAALPPTITAVMMGRAHFAAQRAARAAHDKARTVENQAQARADHSGHGGAVMQPGAVG